MARLKNLLDAMRRWSIVSMTGLDMCLSFAFGFGGIVLAFLWFESWLALMVGIFAFSVGGLLLYGLLRSIALVVWHRLTARKET